MISKLLQLQGASPLTPIEVTSHIIYAEIDVILKILQHQGAKPPDPLCLVILTTYIGFRVMDMTINRYKIDTKPMPFAVKKLHMKNSV